MIRFVFVILHYQNIDDTINCIDSIKRLSGLNNENYKIVLVDNKSPNNTGIELKNKFCNEEQIDVILLDKNYGFSKANNIAFKKAQEYNPESILVLNNDILFEDENFILKLDKTLKETEGYDIICPDIINLKGEHQNPLRTNEMTLKKALKNMIYETIFTISMNIPGIRKIVFQKRTKRENAWFEKYYTESKKVDSKTFVPFGAFIIYMNNWLKNENVAFVSDTFMYMEEDMLNVYIKEKEYNMLFDEELKVKHLEGQSTKKVSKNEYKIVKFRSKNRAKALYKYIKFYKKIRRKDKKQCKI